MGYTEGDIARMTNDQARQAARSRSNEWTQPRLFSAAAPVGLGLLGASQEDEDGDGPNWGLAAMGIALGAAFMGGNFRQVRKASGALFNLRPSDTISAVNVPLGEAIRAIDAGIIEDVAIVGDLEGRPVSRVIYGIGSDSSYHEDYIVNAPNTLQPGYKLQADEAIGEQAFAWRGVAGSSQRPPSNWTGWGFRYGTPGSAASQAEIAQLPEFQRAQAKLAAGQSLTPNERLLVQQQRGVQVGQTFSVWDTATIVNVEQVGSGLSRVVYGYGYNYGPGNAIDASALLRGFQEVTVAGAPADLKFGPGSKVEKGGVLGVAASLPQNLGKEFGDLAARDLDPYYTASIANVQARLDAANAHLGDLVDQLIDANNRNEPWRAQNLENQIYSQRKTIASYQATLADFTQRQAAITPPASTTLPHSQCRQLTTSRSSSTGLVPATAAGSGGGATTPPGQSTANHRRCQQPTAQQQHGPRPGHGRQRRRHDYTTW